MTNRYKCLHVVLCEIGWFVLLCCNKSMFWWNNAFNINNVFYFIHFTAIAFSIGSYLYFTSLFSYLLFGKSDNIYKVQQRLLYFSREEILKVKQFNFLI